VINCVSHSLYHVFNGFSMCNIYNIGGVHDILYRNIFSSKKKLAYTLLSFIDEDTDSYLIQL